MISLSAQNGAHFPLLGELTNLLSIYTILLYSNHHFFRANFGIFCSTPGIAVARTVNRMKASQMLLTGLPVSSQDALTAGLVSQVAPNDQLEKVLSENVEAIKGKSRQVIALGKRFFYRQIAMDVQSAYAAGTDVMADNLSLPDGKEGIRSFIEKRKAKWT